MGDARCPPLTKRNQNHRS